ncbi:putative hydrogenase nickel incorporation protein HypA 2 [uncultured Desulfobacterium sp.]|uniref:Hydrogenase maturation factor HypA n=1 Tax=uncultured Desulfobacterium sp. TaxID=201089 RepID=A0A445MU40_9BACT|nr:putative hydrogenase nickel incorporation protein HypA 2 [uncultured Desulfobacterium sp.]
MHELSIAQNIIDIVKAEMINYDAKILRAVHLRIGAMSSIMPDSLSFCFEAIISGTELEGATLIIETIPLKGCCKGCNGNFEIVDYMFRCPLCNSHDITIVAGRELAVAAIEVD